MTGFNKSFAVVIGINDYEHGITSLKTAVNDAGTVAELLEEKHQYEVRVILNQEAKLSQLIRLLHEDLKQKVDSDSRLFFYFAGHGIALNGDRGPEGFLVPQDARYGDMSTYLSMQVVHDALLALPCRHFLGVLDCCFAGAFRWSSIRKLIPVDFGTLHRERFDRFIRDPAWQVITSASYDQTAQDIFTLQDDRGQLGLHSPFAAFLIEALHGKADVYPPAEFNVPAGDGVITATELYLYLRDRIETVTEARALRQTPGLYPLNKHDKGEYIFLTPGHKLNLPPAPPLDVSQNPYRGLEPFEEKHHKFFFGRQNLTQQLYEFVKSHVLTVVSGASGSGKSSLVKAGLLPRLRQDQKDHSSWVILPPLRPGETPCTTLSSVLSSIGITGIAGFHKTPTLDKQTLSTGLSNWFKTHSTANLLLVIDQFEELVTLSSNDQERQQFLEVLANIVQIASAAFPNRLHLLLTLRTDFEPQFRNTALEDYWQEAKFNIPEMSRDELRQVIEEPASAKVMYFKPYQLVDQLIDEVINMPGALPLLSFALSELYLRYLRRQEEAKLEGKPIDRAMTQANYEALGGVTRSLTQRADQEYEVLVQQDPAYAQTIRHVMLRMVAVGGELARRRVPLTELEYPEPENTRVQIVIQHFSSSRLLTSGVDNEGQPYIEPAHDVLVRGWQKLLEWKQQNLASLLLQRQITPTANQWKNSSQKGSSRGLLWDDDPRLPLALELLYGTGYEKHRLSLLRWVFGAKFSTLQKKFWLNWSEAKFIQDSFEQKFRYQRNTVGITAFVIVSLTGLTVAAFTQAQLAGIREKAATARNLLDTNPPDGLALAIQAVGQNRSLPFFPILNSVQSLLRDAVATSKEKTHVQANAGFINDVAVNSDDTVIVTGGENGDLQMWDFQGNRVGQAWRGHQQAIKEVIFSPNGTMVASLSHDGLMQIWKIQQTVAESPELYQEISGVQTAAFHPNNASMVVGNRDGALQIRDLTNNSVNQSWQAHEWMVTAVTFNQKGDKVISVDYNGNLEQWDLQGKSIRKSFQVIAGSQFSVAFSPNGEFLASSGVGNNGAGIMQTWQLDGTPITQPNSILRPFETPGGGGGAYAVAFGPDSKIIASGYIDGTIKLWDINGNQVGLSLAGHKSRITSLIFSRDGHTLISSDDSGFVRAWDLQDQTITQTLQTEFDIPIALDGKHERIASCHIHENICLIQDLQGNAISSLFQPINSIFFAAFSPDGTQLATGSGETAMPDSAEDNAVLQLWDSQGKAASPPFSLKGSSVASIAFNSDGNRLVTSNYPDTVQIIDLQSNKVSSPLQIQNETVSSAVFHPNSQTIFAGTQNGKLYQWDIQGNQLNAPFPEFEGAIKSIAFSPDEKTVVIGTEDSTISFLSLEDFSVNQIQRVHQFGVTSVAYSHDGSMIVSGDNGGNVWLWDAQGNAIGQPLTSVGRVISARFGADDETVVVITGDGVTIWNGGNWEDWLETACQRLQYHPILETEERQGARRVCQRYVWEHQ